MSRRFRSTDNPYRTGPFSSFRDKAQAREDRGFLRYQTAEREQAIRVENFHSQPHQPPAPPPPFPAIRVPYRPDNRGGPYGPHTGTIEHESNAERAVRKQFEDFKDRMTLFGMTRKVIDLAVEFGPPGRFQDGFGVLEALMIRLLYSHPAEGLHAQYAGYYLDGKCGRTDIQANGFTGGAWPSKYATNCLGGQAVAELASFEAASSGGTQPTVGHMHFYNTSGGRRALHMLAYQKDPRPTALKAAHPSLGFGHAINPNVMRFSNLTPQPFQAPRASPAPAAAVQQAVVVSVATGGASLPPRVRNWRAARSTPPPKGTKELKSNAGKYAAKVAGLLDRISEGSEVVDAIYQALPADVRKRWEKDRDLDRQGDAAGQYGLAGADWKIQAVFWNVPQIDVNKALTGILLNELSDKLYGAAHKARGDLTGRGRKRNRKPF